MHRALLLAWLLYRTCSAQTLPEQAIMRGILVGLFSGRPAVESQIDWEALEVRQAPDLPNYQSLSATQRAAFRRAFLVTMAGQHPQIQALVPPAGTDYFCRFRFRKSG
ncbi:MAG: hypothetical protein U0931_28645 [Vulcanimicrobiota bacterium]